MAEDNFDGAWLVAEYVYDPDGTFVGVVKQRRYVEPVSPGRLRVTQICEPEATLANHPMAAFAGEWVFELVVDGTKRQYLGPDVVGLGIEWQPGAMTGRGLWPRFGYEFTSFGMLVADDRQLTGGFFSLAGRSMADIVGVAVPSSAGIEPSLDLTARAPRPPGLEGAGLVSRAVGPMRVSFARPSWSEERRILAINDTEGDVVLTVDQITRPGEQSDGGGNTATVNTTTVTEINADSRS